MNPNLSLREAYNQRKLAQQKQSLSEVTELLESQFLIVEKLDTATISRIVDSMNGVEEALGSVLDRLPALKAGLDEAENQLLVLVSGKAGNSPKKTGQMMVSALAFYQNLSSFLRQDLPVLLKSRILGDARKTPDQPVGSKITPAFIQALKIGWENRTGGFFKKLFTSSNIPYINNEDLSHQLSNLSYNELLQLTKVGQTPAVMTQNQIAQVASQVVNQPPTGAAPSVLAPGAAPVAPGGAPRPTDDSGKKRAIAKVLEPYMGSKVSDDLLAAIVRAVK